MYKLRTGCPDLSLFTAYLRRSEEGRHPSAGTFNHLRFHLARKGTVKVRDRGPQTEPKNTSSVPCCSLTINETRELHYTDKPVVWVTIIHTLSIKTKITDDVILYTVARKCSQRKCFTELRRKQN